MNKITALLLALIFFISGCTFNVDVLTPPSPVTQVSGTPASQVTPFVTVTSPVATISPTAVASFTPTLPPPFTDPVFSNARTSSSPDDYNQRSSFPAGTKEVYAIWDYQNMRDGLTIRREWYWNNQLWLKREEPWDFNKYGATGTMRDISIYDDTTGLNSGVYELRLYINNVPQPIGSEVSSPINPWITFSIGADDLSAAASSPDSQWAVEIHSGKRLVLKNTSSGNTSDLYTAREVAYIRWFGDSRHFLFVDRDRSGQRSGTTMGIRDELWLVDVPSGATHLLYRSDTMFVGEGGPIPSFEGNFIAGLEGSDFRDGCFVDLHLIFLELASDFRSANIIKQADFSGVPAFTDSTVYPQAEGGWQSGNLYRVTLIGSCDADKSKLGEYTFNPRHRSAAPAWQQVAGDLGLGMVHGIVTDVNTGAPIANAAVTCVHHSYTPRSLCSGTVLTNASGEYTFTNVFFHDTDSIEITVEAAGYETLKIGWTSFTMNDMEANISLHQSP